MTAQATQQVIANGPRNLIIKYTIGGTPLSDASEATLVNISSLDSNIGVGGYRLEKAQWSLTGMSCALEWESGATNTDLLELSSGEGSVDFSEMGGVINNATLPTGDVVFTTTGYGTAGDGGSMVLEFKKKSSTTVALQSSPDVAKGSIAITGGTAPMMLENPRKPALDALVLAGQVPVATVRLIAGGVDALAFTGNAPTPA